MPRNITVTFSDGTSHVYQNAPDDVTPEQVTARAQKQFPSLSVTALDGGRKEAAAPTAPAPKVLSREDAIKAKAREYVAAQDKNRESTLGTKSGSFVDDLAEVGASARDTVANTLGIGPGIQAFISSKKDGVPYSDALTFWREANKATRDKSIVGEVVGSLVGGGALAKGGQLVLRGVTAAAPTVGNVLSRAVNLQRGQTGRNAARIIGVGAGTGAAQAAGEGEDPAGGAVLGGLTAGATAGVVRGAQGLYRQAIGRPLGRNVDQAAREVISENPDVLAARQAEMSRQAGSNVPLVSALNERDFGAATNRVLKGSPEAVAAAREQTAAYTRGMMDRMDQVLENAGARTGANQFSTLEEMARFRNDTADQLMAPIENNRIDVVELPTEDLERQLTMRAGGRVQGLGNRIQAAIQDITPAERTQLGIPANQHIPEAAQLATRIYAGRGPIDATVRELESVRRLLNGAAAGADRAGNGIDAAAYRNASQQLTEFVSNTYPEYRQMIDTYAAHSRMIDGFEHAAKGKRVSDVVDTAEVDNLRSQEGRVGQRYGELYRQRSAARKNTSSAVALSRDLGAEGALTAPQGVGVQPGSMTENVGAGASARAAEQGQANYDAMQRMMQAGGINAADVGENALNNPETLAYGAALLAGSPLPVTVGRFVAKLLGALPSGFNPQVAENLTRMLFSGDAAETQRALNALRRAGVGEEFMRTQIAPIAGGMFGGGRNEGGNEPVPVDPAPVPADTPTPEANSQFSPQVQTLASKVETLGERSRQDQVSPKGAIGVMQVMPATAPEAAELAGVPFDAERYKTDEEYNRLLGTAYLAEMLEQFEGDEALAVAAYNAGPTAVRRAVRKGGDWLSRLPAETQDYVQRVLG